MGMGDKQTRAAEVDRLETVGRLDFAFADGQLDHDEHSERVSLARQARTLAELTTLVDDLQHAPATPIPPRRPRRRRRRVVGAAVAAVVAFGGVGVYAVAHDGNDEPSVSAAQFAGTGMLTEDALADLIGTISTTFGTTVVEGVHLYDDRAVVHVPDASSPTGSLHYSYSPGGQLHSPEAYGGQAVTAYPNAAPVDLGQLDVPAIVALVGRSVELLGVSSDEAGFRVTVGGGEVWIGVNSNAKDSHLVAALDGEILGVYRCGWGC